MSKYTTKNEWMYWKIGEYRQSMKFTAECNAVEIARMLNEQHEEIETLRTENEKMQVVVGKARNIWHLYHGPSYGPEHIEELGIALKELDPKTPEQLCNEIIEASIVFTSTPNNETQDALDAAVHEWLRAKQ